MVNNRSDCTLGRPCEPRSRRERLHCLVHHDPARDAHQLADLIGRRYDRLIAYAAVNGVDEMPIRDLIALTRVTGRTFALAAEVSDCGFLLLRHPESADAVTDPITELIDVFVATGRLAECHRAFALVRDPASLSDVTAAARRLQTELAEFIQAAESTTQTPLRVAR